MVRRALRGPRWTLPFPAVTPLRSLSPAARGSLLVLVATGVSGMIGPILSLLYETGFNPLAFAVWRGIIGGGALWILILRRRRRDPVGHGIVFGRVSGRERLALAGFVVCNITLNTAVFVAITRIPIAVALLTFNTYPVLLALYGRLTGSERIGPIKILALILGLVGLALVLTASGDPGAEPLDPFGMALAVLASVTGAAWVVFSKMISRVPAEQSMGAALTSTIFVIGGVMLVTGQIDAVAFPVSHPASWLPIVTLCLLSGTMAAVFFTKGVQLISRVRTGVLGLTEPIVATVAAAVILGQVLAPIQLLGGALVLAAAILIQREQEGPMIVVRSDLPDDAEVRLPAGVL